MDAPNEGLVWRKVSGLEPELAARFEQRLVEVLDRWRGTPYMAGQQMRGVGVDCVRFVAAVLDEFYLREPVPIETLPTDAALHARDSAIAGMKRLRELYMPNDPVEDGSLEPADVLVTGPKNGGPGHAMIVGPRRNQLWHAAGNEVHTTGFAFFAPFLGNRIFRVYRMRDRRIAC